MEINKQNIVTNSGVSVSRKVASGSAPKSEPTEFQAPGNIDKPSLSGAGIMVSQLTQRIMNESPIDESRVARLAAQIQSGQYQIDDQRVASKMIAFDQAIQPDSHET